MSAMPLTAARKRTPWDFRVVPLPDSCSAAKTHHSITSSASASILAGINASAGFEASIGCPLYLRTLAGSGGEGA
jgi:hypothetical protein